jgi:hypothetical protein
MSKTYFSLSEIDINKFFKASYKYRNNQNIFLSLNVEIDNDNINKIYNDYIEKIKQIKENFNESDLLILADDMIDFNKSDYNEYNDYLVNKMIINDN